MPPGRTLRSSRSTDMPVGPSPLRRSHVRERASLRRHPRAGRAPRRRLPARLVRLGAGRQGRARVESIERFACAMGPAGRRVRSPDLATAHLAAVRGDGQRRRVALRRAGRRAQRLGVSSGRRRLSAGARRRAGARRVRPRALTAAVAGYEVGIRVGEFLGRSHYKVFHTTGTAGTVAAAAAAGRCCASPLADAARVRLGRHAGRRSVGIPARRGRLEAAAHREGCRRRAHRRLSRAGRLHRRHAHPRGPAGHGGRHVDRRRSGAAHRPPGRALGARRRPRSSSTRRAGTRTPRPTRCCRSSSTHRSCARATSRGSPRACTRPRSTCWAR